MDAEQALETTMDPARRTMLRVSLKTQWRRMALQYQWGTK